MVDFKKALADLKAKARPSMVPANLEKRAKKAPEVLPTLAELIDEPALFRTLEQQFEEHARLGVQERAIKARRSLLGDGLKDVCAEFKLRKLDASGTRVAYYPVTRRVVSPDLLRKAGVSQKIINDSTVVTTSWTLRTGVPGETLEETDGEE